MRPLPLRVRARADGSMLFVGDSGRFFLASEEMLDRYTDDELTTADLTGLSALGHACEVEEGLDHLAHARMVAQRIAHPGPLDYLILVPTLRCNLSCSYCQVSRAALGAAGFDWSSQTLADVLRLIDGIGSPSLKIEFQGGEPTLRLDLLRQVIDRCSRFEDRQFVICTNLSRVDDEFLALTDREDVYISTSLDGAPDVHRRNRTGNHAANDIFLRNLDFLIARYGPGKISALPTIDPLAPPEIDALIDAYAGRGLNGIYLRPVNYHGFARKRHKASRDQSEDWNAYYRTFVRRLIARNWDDRSRVLEETYLSICLRRVFQPGHDRHVDLRNPNPVGMDYVVIDHDGRVYPTDEARMLSRSGVIDLSLGDVRNGWESETKRALNLHSTNQFDPDCLRCTYQPYCGRDLVDDLARYGRIDLPRTETAFCRRHTQLFDFLFELIYDPDPAVQYSLARWLRLPGGSAELGPRLA